MLGAVKTTGVNWQSVGTILAGVAAVGALIMGRLESARKSMASDISSEVSRQLVELRERVSRLEGERREP